MLLSFPVFRVFSMCFAFKPSLLKEKQRGESLCGENSMQSIDRKYLLCKLVLCMQTRTWVLAYKQPNIVLDWSNDISDISVSSPLYRRLRYQRYCLPTSPRRRRRSQLASSFIYSWNTGLLRLKHNMIKLSLFRF